LSDDGPKVQITQAPTLSDDGPKVQITQAPTLSDDGPKVQITQAPTQSDDGPRVQITQAPTVRRQSGAEPAAGERPLPPWPLSTRSSRRGSLCPFPGRHPGRGTACAGPVPWTVTWTPPAPPTSAPHRGSAIPPICPSRSAARTSRPPSVTT